MRRTGPGRRVDVHAIDVVLAVAVAAVPLVGIAAGPAADQLDAVGVTLLLAMGSLLLVHRTAPVVTFLAIAVLHVTYNVLGQPEGSDWLATVAALGSVSWARGWRWGAPLGGVLLVMGATGGFRDPLQVLHPETVLIALGLGGAVAAGEWLRTRDAYLAGLEERSAMLERTRADEARRMVDDERLRIARDVHDVVAHAIASINVQAGVGAHLADRDPAEAARALGRIREASGGALRDLRAMLGMLRPDDDGTPLRPRTLEDLPEVLEGARTAGLAVHLVQEGALAGLPAPVAGTAFRIVQESVTNALRHAQASAVRLALRRRGDVLEVEVTDDGIGAAASPAVDGHGYGIRGMHERAALLGGRLEAGPTAGGFRVHARLPLRDVVGARTR